MKTLLLLRHAHAEAAVPGKEDHQRTLGERGRNAALRVGRLLHDEGLAPDGIVSSTAERARATAAAVAETCRFEREVQVSRRLYDGDAAGYVQALRGLGEDGHRVLLVGHNPAAEELMRLLTGREESMPPATLARILLPLKTWNELDEDTLGKLVQLWRPSDLS